MFSEPFYPDSCCILSFKTCHRSRILLGHVGQRQVDPRRDMLTPKIIKRESWGDRSFESHSQRMGSVVWCPCKYVIPIAVLLYCHLSADSLLHSVAFGHITTRLTAAKEEGAFVTTPDGNKVALGIPKAQKEAAGSNVHADIPLRRPGTAREAASAILAVASPLFSYVNGQTIMVSSPFQRSTRSNS